jgi:N-methylhydantoinase A
LAENITAKGLRCGVDIGGTFTDLVIVDEKSATIYIDKCLTTPTDPSVGVLSGLTSLTKEYGLDPKDIANIIHATTLMTNALIERKGAKTGLVTTKGFRDVLEIGREIRYDLYDLFLELPQPLVPRQLRKEVSERTTSDGQIYTALDVDELKEVAGELEDAGVKAVAVCFLHSYVNSEHELTARRILVQEYPHLVVSLSCEVAPEIREYERASTTVANAYVQPLTAQYLGHLEEELADLGFCGNLYMMLSSGGISTTKTAREFPVRLIESGPAAGALVGGFYGTLVGEDDVIAFDMGGTTAKICLVEKGQPMTTFTFEAARVQRFKRGSGLPLKAPSIELIEIGAGGGSIAHVNEIGLLKVGPQSAGAHPGPACYGFGGSEPTVTDAGLVLGYLNPEYFLGGEMTLDVEAARESIRRQVGAPLKLDEIEAAWGIYDIVNENMASATRIQIAEKGRDPRRYTLVATGGGGPLHAYRVAKKLQIKSIICPLGAGVASAIGLLVAPPKLEFVRSYVTGLDEVDWERLNGVYEEMEGQGTSTLREAGVTEAQMRLSRMADMRYVGQGHEIVVAVPSGRLTPESLDVIENAFHRLYEEVYGRSTKDVPIEALNWRSIASGPYPEVTFITDRRVKTEATAAGVGKGTRQAFLPESGGFVEIPVYDRYQLLPGARFNGPAIIEEKESTVLVGPEADFHVDAYRNVVMELR